MVIGTGPSLMKYKREFPGWFRIGSSIAWKFHNVDLTAVSDTCLAAIHGCSTDYVIPFEYEKGICYHKEHCERPNMDQHSDTLSWIGGGIGPALNLACLFVQEGGWIGLVGVDYTDIPEAEDGDWSYEVQARGGTDYIENCAKVLKYRKPGVKLFTFGCLRKYEGWQHKELRDA